MELVLAPEELVAARLALVHAHRFGVGVLAHVRRLGCGAAQHFERELIEAGTKLLLVDLNRVGAAHLDLGPGVRREGHPCLAVAVVPLRVLLKVALVVLLGLPEGDAVGGEDLAHDRAVARSGQRRAVELEAGFNRLALVVVRVVHGAAVLRANIATLAVQRRGVVHGQELLEEAAVRDLLVVEDDLHHLGVAGAAGADLLVGGRLGVATHIANGGLGDAGHLPEAAVRTPEAASGEVGSFNHGRSLAALHAHVINRHLNEACTSNVARANHHTNHLIRPGGE